MRGTALGKALGAMCAAATMMGVLTPGASAAVSDQACTAPAVFQPFAGMKDSHWYTMAPGGTFDDAAGGGWAFTGGASIVRTTEPDGSSNGVLDLPSRAQAQSPVMCITSDMPTARLWVRNLKGSEGVFFYVSYYVNGVWTNNKNTGQFHGANTSWTPSTPMNVQPSSAPGWQYARFTFIAGGNSSRFQVNDFWVDPRMRT